jgi:CspA family cold shock protein
MNGVVESFDSHRGLGYINAGGEQYLFHCAEIVDGTREIVIGVQVQFVVAHRFGNQEASEIYKL